MFLAKTTSKYFWSSLTRLKFSKLKRFQLLQKDLIFESFYLSLRRPGDRALPLPLIFRFSILSSCSNMAGVGFLRDSENQANLEQKPWVCLIHRKSNVPVVTMIKESTVWCYSYNFKGGYIRRHFQTTKLVKQKVEIRYSHHLNT